MRLSPVAAAAAALLPLPALAQTAAPAEERISQVIVYGNDPCPAGGADEIVVCARKPEAERYRIPERLRGDPNDPKNRAWSDRATELQYVGRSGIGSCSPVGAGGAVGCLNDLIRQARAERRSPDEINWKSLIEQARRERLGEIDAKAAAEEADPKGPR